MEKKYRLVDGEIYDESGDLIRGGQNRLDAEVFATCADTVKLRNTTYRKIKDEATRLSEKTIVREIAYRVD